MKMNMSKLLTIECILSDDKKEYYQKRREILDLISENDYYELMKKEGLLRDIEYAEKYIYNFEDLTQPKFILGRYERIELAIINMLKM